MDSRSGLARDGKREGVFCVAPILLIDDARGVRAPAEQQAHHCLVVSDVAARERQSGMAIDIHHIDVGLCVEKELQAGLVARLRGRGVQQSPLRRRVDHLGVRACSDQLLGTADLPVQHCSLEGAQLLDQLIVLGTTVQELKERTRTGSAKL